MLKIIVCLVAFIMAPCFAAQPLPILKVVSEEWQDSTNADGSGTYWDIVRAVYGKHYQLELVATTWSRALSLVEAGQADVLVGSYKTANPKLIFPQHHLDIEYPLYAIFDKNLHNITDVNDLAGLTIAGKKDYELTSFLPSTSHFYGVEFIDDVANLIEKKRIDVALAYHINLPLADPNNRFKHQVIGKEARIYLAYTKSAKGERLKQQYDEEIIRLIADDKLKQYFPNEKEYQHAQFNNLLP